MSERYQAQQALVAAVDRLDACRLDEADDRELSEELVLLETEARRLTARQHRIARTLTRRRARRREQAGEQPDRAESRAEQDTGRQLGEQLQWSPSQASEATDIGRGREDAPDVGDALDRGRLSSRHARVLLDTLNKIADPQLREHAEQRLLEAAAKEHAPAFGRTCRRLLAELDPQAAERDAERRQRRRRARTTTTPDGMFALHAELAGIDGETVATGLDAFRRPDASDEHRTPSQATADALVEMAAAALRAGEAPTSHGVRPHVVITVAQEALTTGRGAAEGTWMGPLPISEARRAIIDSRLSAIIHDTRRVPLEATAATSSAPQGLYRALLTRDGGCIAAGCDAPPGWCDVMHLEVPAHREGRLRPLNAALGCRQHHRAYDSGRLKLHWNDGIPTLGRRPARPVETKPLPPGLLEALRRQDRPPTRPEDASEPGLGPEPRRDTGPSVDRDPGRRTRRSPGRSQEEHVRAEPGRAQRGAAPPDTASEPHAPYDVRGKRDDAREEAGDAREEPAAVAAGHGRLGHQQITASCPSG